MAAISLFWDTNMAAVTSCENTLFSLYVLFSQYRSCDNISSYSRAYVRQRVKFPWDLSLGPDSPVGKRQTKYGVKKLKYRRAFTYKLKRSISKIITFFCLQIRERFKKRVRLVHPVASDGTSAYKRQSGIKDSSGVIFLRKIDLKTKSTDAFEKNTF